MSVAKDESVLRSIDGMRRTADAVAANLVIRTAYVDLHHRPQRVHGQTNGVRHEAIARAMHVLEVAVRDIEDAVRAAFDANEGDVVL